MASLVGYTNAGKSTLFNALSSAGVIAADQLFSTLDPVTRRIRLPSGAPLLLSDTVGFIQKLSPKVIAAFRATLDELERADILLQVVDITHPKAADQAEVVEQTLEELGLAGRPRLLAANKIDLLPSTGNGPAPLPPGWENPGHSAVPVSAAKGWNLDGLLREIEETLVNLEGPLWLTPEYTGRRR